MKPYELIFRKSNLLDWNDLLLWISWTWSWGRVCPAWWKWSDNEMNQFELSPRQSQFFDLIPRKSPLLDWNGLILWFSLTWSLGSVCQSALLDRMILSCESVWRDLEKFWPVGSNWSNPASLTWSLGRVKFAGTNWVHLVDLFDLIFKTFNLLDRNDHILQISLPDPQGEFDLLVWNDFSKWISLTWSWGNFWPVGSNWSYLVNQLTWSLGRVFLMDRKLWSRKSV